MISYRVHHFLLPCFISYRYPDILLVNLLCSVVALWNYIYILLYLYLSGLPRRSSLSPHILCKVDSSPIFSYIETVFKPHANLVDVPLVKTSNAFDRQKFGLPCLQCKLRVHLRMCAQSESHHHCHPVSKALHVSPTQSLEPLVSYHTGAKPELTMA